MISETHDEREARSTVGRALVEEMGALVRYSEFRERMAVLGFRPLSHNWFDAVRDQVWPDWRAAKKEAKQKKYIHNEYPR